MNGHPANTLLEPDENMALDTAVLLDTMAQAVIANAAELTELDSAIGDADHGLIQPDELARAKSYIAQR